MVKRFRKNGVLYSFYLPEKGGRYLDYIIVVVTGPDFEKVVNVPVRDCAGYRVKINKKSCSAAGGARGLFSFVGNCIDSNFMMDWVYKIIFNFSGVTV